jgi:hypothetical protein
MARKPRILAEFDTTIPDDTLENSYEIVNYGGEDVAIALGELLRRPGRQVEPPYYAEICGWRFTVRTRRRKLFFQVQFIEKVLLVTDDFTWPHIFGKPNYTELVQVLEDLNEDMQRDGRFSNIKWCTEEEIFDMGPGGPVPALVY